MKYEIRGSIMRRFVHVHPLNRHPPASLGMTAVMTAGGEGEDKDAGRTLGRRGGGGIKFRHS